MARHERYGEATNDVKRRFMAEKLFPEHEGLHSRIAETAGLIYWWEVEPLERVTTEEKVQKLRSGGHSIRNIAAILGISEQKVRRGLSEADP